MQLGQQQESSLVDGFLYSASQLYLPTNYRASALVQMEVLRRAKGYRTRWYNVPEDLEQPVPAYGQLEYQVQVQPGSYVWGLAFAIRSGGSLITAQITDACTETPFFSDYIRASALTDTAADGAITPMLITPRLVGQPGLLDVEIYNASSTNSVCQLVLFCAEPIVPPGELLDVLVAMGKVVAE